MEEYEEKICQFKKYVKQTMDLMLDSYKWKLMAKYCDSQEMKEKYLKVSDTLYELFMNEHNEIGSIFNEATTM